MFACVVLALAISVVLTERVDVADGTFYVYIADWGLQRKLKLLDTDMEWQEASRKAASELRVGGPYMGDAHEYENIEKWEELIKAEDKATKAFNKKKKKYDERKSQINLLYESKNQAANDELATFKETVDELHAAALEAQTELKEARDSGVLERAEAEKDTITKRLQKRINDYEKEIAWLKRLQHGLYKVNMDEAYIEATQITQTQVKMQLVAALGGAEFTNIGEMYKYEEDHWRVMGIVEPVNVRGEEDYAVAFGNYDDAATAIAAEVKTYPIPNKGNIKKVIKVDANGNAALAAAS